MSSARHAIFMLNVVQPPSHLPKRCMSHEQFTHHPFSAPPDHEAGTIHNNHSVYHKGLDHARGKV